VRGRTRWTLVVLYVLAVYSTLGAARGWSQCLRQLNILHVAVGLSLVAGFVAAVGWKWQSSSVRKRILRAGTACVLLSLALSLALPEERLHLVEYGVLGWMLAWAMAGGDRWPKCWPVAVVLAWVIGWGDELIQAVLPNRVYDVRDILLNGFSGMAGLMIYDTGRTRQKCD
jgi:hypothetical protein